MYHFVALFLYIAEADIKKWFERADFDHSGTLSKREFVVMYVGLLADKAKVR